MGRRHLRFKINVSILAAAAILAVVCIGLFYPYQKRQQTRRLEEIRVLLTAIYDQRREDLANEIFAEQAEALDVSLKNMMSVPGVTALHVYRLDGKLLRSTQHAGAQSLSLQERARLDAGASFGQVEAAGRPLAEFGTVIEVIGERVGYLKIYFDLGELEQDTQISMLLIVGGLILMLGIMALSLNLMLTRSVLRPVQALQEAIRKLRRGALGEQVAVVRSDEIGDMAAAFNAMSIQLKTQNENLVASMKARDDYFSKMEKSNLALEKLNLELESRVEERTAQLRSSYEKLREQIGERERALREKERLEERLAQSRKMEALGLLAGGVAHDLNNVLSGIVSYPDLLLMELPEESLLRTPIETMRSSGQKAAAIVQDLLTLARRGVTNTEVVDFNVEVVQDYIESAEYRKLLDFHPGVEVDVHLATDLHPIRGSAMHLRKTLMNLVSNAAEAQPDGGEIRIATENRHVAAGEEETDMAAGDYVVLRVSDKGDGIATEDMGRIFEPFYTKKKMGRSGTGLGMAVVWGTVQDHHGFIHPVSHPGKGTQFELFFPATREKKNATGSAPSHGRIYRRG